MDTIARTVGRERGMKNIMCLLGNHIYSDASAEVNAVDERDGCLICRVRNFCLRCGKPYEDIVQIPIPKWLCKKREGEEDEERLDATE